MSDSASGPIAGYLFQFEKALLMLASLEKTSDRISIEKVDDVAAHDSNGVVLMTVQAKHSLAAAGTTFEDTSYALWRTLEIWIQKLNKNIFSNDTKFVCSTNKNIGEQSLLRKIVRLSFNEVLQELNVLLKSQQDKLKQLLIEDPKSGSTIKETIKRIRFVLKYSQLLEIVKTNLTICDNENIKEQFLVKIHMMSDDKSDLQRENVYTEFYGWIIYGSKAMWLNGQFASFAKKDFDNKWSHINSNPTIVNAIFRKKDEILGSISQVAIEKAKAELFVKQIEDLKRNKASKERKINEAIQDFLSSDIEIARIISKGNYTSKDFEDFHDECIDIWQTCFDSHVVDEIEEYDDQTKDDFAVKIFDYMMGEIELKFKEGFAFTTSNKYTRKGSILKLSNIPKIGWHPEWKIKYTNND